MGKIRLGLMGFGEIGRSLYKLCLEDDRIEVVAISDIGNPDILHYLLTALTLKNDAVKLEKNYFVSEKGRTRIMQGASPQQVPWDAYDVDFVVDATGKYRSSNDMKHHLESGARRAIVAFLPDDMIDRLVVMGVNDQSIQATDRLISAGSSTTNAAAIMLKILNDAFGVEAASLAAIHEYTADQPLRDTVGKDFRRSRSAAENIIPNLSPSVRWLPYLLPELEGKIEGLALNVPVPAGTLMDLNTFLRKPDFSIDDVHAAIAAAAVHMPEIVEVVEDPIVSSDIIGNTHSLIYDKQATMKSAGKIVKTMSWYHSATSLSARIKEVILAYDQLDKKGGSK